jgi:DNA-binding NarL/FixJ family response regulator
LLWPEKQHKLDNMDTIRVLLADDHDLVRAGFRSLVQSFPGVEVVGEAGDGRAAIRQIEIHRPHVVLMDIMMPGLNGLEATTRIVKEFPKVRVIILSMNAAEEYVLKAMRVGAAGYLLKDGNPAELEQAIRAVARGETFLSSKVSQHVVSGYIQRASGPETGTDKLTSRQREILQLIAEGNTTKEIAKKLDISVKTVETHRMQLMERLDIHDIAGLVRYALRVGLIEQGT